MKSTYSFGYLDEWSSLGARGVGGQRTALVLPLQPRLHPPVSPPVCAPLDTVPVFAQSFRARRGANSAVQVRVPYAGFATED